MQEHDDGTAPVLADEAAHAAGVEPAPGGAVDSDHLRDVGVHRADDYRKLGESSSPQAPALAGALLGSPVGSFNPVPRGQEGAR